MHKSVSAHQNVIYQIELAATAESAIQRWRGESLALLFSHIGINKKQNGWYQKDSTDSNDLVIVFRLPLPSLSLGVRRSLKHSRT